MNRQRQIHNFKVALRIVIAGLVVWGVYHASRKAYVSIEEHGFSLLDFDGKWIAAAGLLYAIGLSHCWWFWFRTMRAMNQRPGVMQSMFAYFLGHLGKYVPGKALVVVLRTAYIKGPDVNSAIAALAVAVETLTMMAVGAAIGGACLLFVNPPDWMLPVTVLAIICAAFPTVPPVFRFVVKLLKISKTHESVPRAIEGLTWPLMAEGWLVIASGWLFMSASLAAILQSTPGVDLLSQNGLQFLPLIIGTVTLAMVLGFASLLPGGVGVRELVVFALITQIPGINDASALVGALLLRLVWLVAELVASGTLWSVARLWRTDDA